MPTPSGIVSRLIAAVGVKNVLAVLSVFVRVVDAADRNSGVILTADETQQLASALRAIEQL